MVKDALNGFGRPASIPWPRESLGFDAGQDQTYTHDLGKARQLLESAGWNIDTRLPLLIPSRVPATRTMAEIYQADLAAIGVTVLLQEVDLGDLYARLQNGQVGGAWIVNMGYMNLSPATFLNSAFPVRTPNPSHFETQRYTDLLHRVRSETDAQRLKAHLNEVTQIMLDEAFIAPIAEATGASGGLEVTRNSVRGASWNILGLFAYQDVWL
jgi:peptide/nickel transport system substrate-binding protein